MAVPIVFGWHVSVLSDWLIATLAISLVTTENSKMSQGWQDKNHACRRCLRAVTVDSTQPQKVCATTAAAALVW
jgi:hypothetical protein